ncbi:MAG: hypothetical protein UZ21_OP11001000932 [Microgenomates bacterium OLB22]|nr:MAG: hypothetical protein UZ21_OP11001000932 [Microgenomates bacterium OLB22]
MIKIPLPKIRFEVFKKKSILFSIGGVLVLTCLLGVGGYFAYQYYSLKQAVQDPTKASIKELEYVIAKVGRLMQLPQGEQPLLATVDDVNKLRDKPFFRSAHNGDKALFYSKAGKAILYRPSTDKIIEIGPYIVPTTTTAPVPVASDAAALGVSTTPVTVTLLNGTAVSGLAKTTEEKLTSKIKGIQVVEKKDATKKDYVKNIIIDIKGDQSQLVGNIQSLIGGEVASAVPEGEATPEAAIVIILGNDT